MPFMFTNNPAPIVETVSEEDNILEREDDELLDGGKTEASASEYEGFPVH